MLQMLWFVNLTCAVLVDLTWIDLCKIGRLNKSQKFIIIL